VLVVLLREKGCQYIYIYIYIYILGARVAVQVARGKRCKLGKENRGMF
jgi:hypothetical protein